MNSKPNPALFIIILLSAGVVAACADYSRGARIFRRELCHECHTIHGKGGSVGPNLSTVGGRRSRQYIVDQIKNPGYNNPDSNMPSFKDRLSEEDINALADYLSRLK